jgi:hypothetical protein
VSEWLLFNANSAIFQLYHGENKLIFNEMMMTYGLALYPDTSAMYIASLTNVFPQCRIANK